MEADADRAVAMAWQRLKDRPKPTESDIELMIGAQRVARGQWIFKKEKKAKAKAEKAGLSADSSLADVGAAAEEDTDD